MKKWGLCLVLLVAMAFVFVSPSQEAVADASVPPGSVNLMNTNFPNRDNIFRTGQDSNGIFVIRDNSRNHGESVYHGTVAITPQSGELNNFNRFKFVSQRYMNGNWTQTPFLFLTGAEGIVSQRTVTYNLFKNAPAGRYRIWVQAFNYDDSPALGVESFYNIVHGESFSAVSMTFNGRSIIDASGRLGDRIFISVAPNNGAVTSAVLRHNVVGGNTTMGAFSPATFVSIQNMQYRVENISGEEVSNPSMFNVTKIGGVARIDIPNYLEQGVYVIRFWHPSNSAISGTFVIDNSGIVFGGDGDLGVFGIILIVFGVMLAIGGGVMFGWPRLAILLQHSAADRLEERRLKQAGALSKKEQEKEARTAYEKVKKITKELEESKSLSDADRQRLLKEREDEYSRTKTGGFLQKLNDNRMKREMARAAGLTIDEFNEHYNKQKKIEVAKEEGLADVRKEHAEINVDAITQKQEEEMKPVERKKLAHGEIEMNLLDSVKMEAVVNQVSGVEGDVNKVVQENLEAQKESQKPTSILDRIRNLSEE